MLRYFVILKCEVVKTRHRVLLSVDCWKIRYLMRRYCVILKCEERKKTPHASLLCDTEV